MLNVLGIDGALTCGWGFISGISRKPWGWGILRLDPGGSQVARAARRFHYARAAFVDLIDRLEPDLVAYEYVPFNRSFQNAAACLSYVTILLALEDACAAHRRPIVAMPSAEVKKYATGSGVATKPDMVDFTLSRWGIALDEGAHDVADALWVAALAASRT